LRRRGGRDQIQIEHIEEEEEEEEGVFQRSKRSKEASTLEFYRV
jgi:hypothetical protein